MKVNIGNYVNNFNSDILEKHLVKKYGFGKYVIMSSKDFDNTDVFFEKLDNVLQAIYDLTINKLLEYKKRKIEVKIHDYDIYNADTTLAYVIVPVLKKLKENKHGAPFVDKDDVPENLRPTDEELRELKKYGTTDSKYFERWDYVLDSMIWSFDQIIKENNGESDLFIKNDSFDFESYQKHNEKVDYGLKMFGKYYRALWD